MKTFNFQQKSQMLKSPKTNNDHPLQFLFGIKISSDILSVYSCDQFRNVHENEISTICCWVYWKTILELKNALTSIFDVTYLNNGMVTALEISNGFPVYSQQIFEIAYL